jgi:multiple sugar transport system substrate-binding protein
MLSTESNLFPTQKSRLNDPEFVNAPLAFAGGQKVNSVFIDASSNVDEGFEWSPFQDYVYAQLAENVGAAAKGDTTIPDAMDKTQSNVTDYAEEQGFKVQ